MRLFADKYEIVCEQLKRKDKALRNIEAERDLHDESLVSLREEKRMLVDAFGDDLSHSENLRKKEKSILFRSIFGCFRGTSPKWRPGACESAALFAFLCMK